MPDEEQEKSRVEAIVSEMLRDLPDSDSDLHCLQQRIAWAARSAIYAAGRRGVYEIDCLDPDDPTLQLYARTLTALSREFARRAERITSKKRNPQ